MTGSAGAGETPRGALRHAEPMARHTSWRVGGPADVYFAPADIDALADFVSTLPADQDPVWLGLGSNMLVRDGGIRGVVIALSGLPEDLQVPAAGTVQAGAGVACAKVARFAAQHELSGAEFLAGIPGTVGGALAMNAGAFGSETWDIVQEVETLDRYGIRHRRSPSEFAVAYRSVSQDHDEWFLSARLRLTPDPSGQARDRIRELLRMRAASQPTGRFSCGSVFRNPPGEHAGRLIDQCGLKGVRRGGAYVSEKHANFIINEGNATAADIEGLIEQVRETVRLKTGILLQPEVRIVGEPPPGTGVRGENPR